MTEEKHFTYEGFVTIQEPDVQVLDVRFLVPISIKCKFEDSEEEQIIMAQIDYVNREVFLNNQPFNSCKKLKERILEYLNKAAYAIPGNQYSAPKEVIDKATEIRRNQELIQEEQIIGDLND